MLNDLISICEVSIIEEGSDRSYEESSTSEESTTFQVEDNIQQEPDQEETEKDKLQGTKNRAEMQNCIY